MIRRAVSCGLNPPIWLRYLAYTQKHTPTQTYTHTYTVSFMYYRYSTLLTLNIYLLNVHTVCGLDRFQLIFFSITISGRSWQHWVWLCQLSVNNGKVLQRMLLLAQQLPCLPFRAHGGTQGDYCNTQHHWAYAHRIISVMLLLMFSKSHKYCSIRQNNKMTYHQSII